MPFGPGLDAYREVWLADFEFSAPRGERPILVCLVARSVGPDSPSMARRSPKPSGSPLFVRSRRVVCRVLVCSLFFGPPHKGDCLDYLNNTIQRCLKSLMCLLQSQDALNSLGVAYPSEL